MDWFRGAISRGLLINIVGALLVLAGVGLEAMTARGLLNFREASSRHGGEFIDLGRNARPQGGEHGYMARLVGTPKVIEAPHDPDFNQRADTPVLVRHVEMFQWREIRIGDSVHYELDWVDHPIDSSRFSEPAGHVNPQQFPLVGERYRSSLVQLDGFKLSPLLIDALPGSVTMTPDPKQLPANLAASFSAYQDYLVTSADPGDPRLGDLRVSWIEVPVQQMTIVSRINGDQLVAASEAADGKGYEMQVGDVSLLDIFPDLPVPPSFVLANRVIALALAAFGAYLLISVHRKRREPLLAIALGALAVGIVASALWLGGDAMVMCGWLLVAGLGAAYAVWRLRLQPR